MKSIVVSYNSYVMHYFILPYFFFQFPPVRDKFEFSNGISYNPGSTHLWRDDNKLMQLTQ
uniref:Uncharacterized protein n=1 Tax=Amphimedon queenslandica TaxID=400682 RepID=A0A1X7VSE5_AMPQE